MPDVDVMDGRLSDCGEGMQEDRREMVVSMSIDSRGENWGSDGPFSYLSWRVRRISVEGGRIRRWLRDENRSEREANKGISGSRVFRRLCRPSGWKLEWRSRDVGSILNREESGRII